MNAHSQIVLSKMRKLKLMKDLKYGKVHLRQSLIELNEFQDINKLYKNKKQSYAIIDQQVSLKVQKVQQSEQQTNILISPVQRIQQYRKQKQSKRMKQKMVKQFEQKKIHYNKLRTPKTMKMLQKFQDKYRNQMPISYKQRLRQSEINLQKIKRNDKSKLQVGNSSQKPLYHSRLHSNGRVIVTESEEQISPYSKKRFMSLKTSLPQKQKFIYPSLRQIMKGKLRQKVKGPIIDVKSIQNTLDNYVNQTIKRFRITIQKQKDIQMQKRSSMISSPKRIKSQSMTNRQQKRKKSKSNAETSFSRSEETSKNMIQTMSHFYETKRVKKQIFDSMHRNLKYDRPLTSSIRRKHYLTPGEKGMLSIHQYRQFSEQQRTCIRSRNYQFYCKIIQELQMYHEDDIPTTVYIIEQLKRIFETEYRITPQILKQLIQSVNTMKMDQKTQQILNQIAEYMGLSLLFTPQQNSTKKDY